MQLSVIIVNYNVKHFLEQCLWSVKKAMTGMEVEVIVVDNNSADGSQQMLREKFADWVIIIENAGNPGYSVANNQGMRIAKGTYILLLNPDTVVEENTFKDCWAFMESRPDVGGLGVKMIDGTGNFLPESKRALPTPWVSFYKIFGLSALFPKSKVFGKYHLTYLDKNENHEVEILCGAFMWMRKAVLDEIGLLDEAFFMYGEDVDLSWRIIQGGYKNYYFSDTQIIHYKGESTKKGSLNYVKVFYQAMIIFAKKHFSGSYQQIFILMIQFAVYFRALGAVLFRLVKQWGFPILEGGLFFVAIELIKTYWEKNHKYVEGGSYPATFDWIAAPIYALLFVGLLWITGGYKKPFKIRPVITAPLSAFIAIATVSYLFPVINFSRAIVGLSSIFALLIALTTRGLQNFREKRNFFFTEVSKKHTVLVGNPENMGRILQFLHDETEYPIEIEGLVTDAHYVAEKTPLERLGILSQLPEIIRMYGVEEVVFCNKSLPTERIISIMSALAYTGVEFKIVPPDADYIVGSQFIHTSRSYRAMQSKLQSTEAKRQKRMLDVSASLLGVMLWPVTCFLYKNPLKALAALWQILIGKAHFVGYTDTQNTQLPPLKPAYLTLLDRASHPLDMPFDSLNRFYARTWSWDLDIEIMLKAWRNLGV